MLVYTASIRYVAYGDGSSPLHWVYHVLGDTIHPHRLYPSRSRNGTQAVPYGFAGRWILSTTQVIFATWRAADCRPYRRSSIHPHGVYLLRGMAMNHRRYIAYPIHPHGLYWGRPRNGTQAVPYGFAGGRYRSTARVVFGTWRAANSRPYGHTGGLFYSTTRNRNCCVAWWCSAQRIKIY